MKFPALATLAVALPLIVSGCGSKIQSDLQIENARFSVNESGKSMWSGTVKNIGQSTYKSVFIVIYAYENDEYVCKIQTSADLFGNSVLAPGGTAGFSKEYEDGGFKPTRYELYRLYGLE